MNEPISFPLSDAVKKMTLEALLAEFPYMKFEFNGDDIRIPMKYLVYNLIIDGTSGTVFSINGKYYKKDTVQYFIGCCLHTVQNENIFQYTHMKAEIDKLRGEMTKKLDTISEMLGYAPGGPAYEDTKRDFEEKAANY